MPANLLLIFLGAAAFFNLLLLVVSFFLLLSAKKNIEFSRKVEKIEGTTKAEVEAHLEKITRQFLDEMIASLRLSLADVQGQYLKTVQEAAVDQIKALADFVRDQQGTIAKQAAAALERELAGAKEEIANYRRGQMAKIDEQVPKIIEAAATAVLRESIDLSAHEDLVMEALARAKSEGIFEEVLGKTPKWRNDSKKN